MRHCVAGLDVGTITANANVFRRWYSDEQNDVAAALLHRDGSVQYVLRQAAKNFFASWYQPGGRMNRTGEVHALGSPTGFEEFEVPRGFMRDVLRILYSQQTQAWLRVAESNDTRDVARGFRSQVATDGAGELQLYKGTSVVQFRKTMTFVLNTAGVSAMEARLPRRAFYAAMVTVTRHKKYQAAALTDAKAVKLFGVLDLRYSFDATFAAAAGESEELALRLNEIYNQQLEDVTMTPAGMDEVLPRSKADQERTGIKRGVKHRRGCEEADKEGLCCSLRSAMPLGADGKPDARRRCQVCMKRLLLQMQGPRCARSPSFLRLKPHVKPSWEYEEGKGLSSPDDFVQPVDGQSEAVPALQYTWFNEALTKVALRANKVFGASFEERDTHWHGWRHSTPCNWMELVPKPTLAEICLWCRMTEKTVMLYLKHNGVGGDTSNRTDQISGAQTLSINSVAAWCATQNRLVQSERIVGLFAALGFADVDNFVTCDPDALRRHLGRNTTITLGEEEALVGAHKHYGQALGPRAAAMEAAGERADDRSEVEQTLRDCGLNPENFADVADDVWSGI